MQAPAPIPVYRPSYLTDGLEFQGSLVESPANIFYQRVKASRANLVGGSGRMQFQWRSVSDNLLMSPTVMLRFRLKIRCPTLWNQIQQYIAVQGVRGTKVAIDIAAAYDGDVGHTAANQVGTVTPAAICFADGDAFTSCCSAINLTFNGTSLSLNRTDKFWRDYMRTQVSSDDAARIYKSAGGAYDKNDSVGVGFCDYRGTGTNNAYVDNAVDLNNSAHLHASIKCGLSLDSGIAERCKTFYALLEDSITTVNNNALTGENDRILQVSYPVPVAPLNPWRGYALPATSPYKNTPLAIPHLSAGGLDFLIEDFEKAFLRRMGCPIASDGNVATSLAFAQGRGNSTGAPYKVSLEAGSAELELKYFRLAHTRSLKESYRFNVWQSQTFLASMVDIAAQGHALGADGVARMVAIGKDPTTERPGEVRGQASIAFDSTQKTWKVTFDTINLAQVPSFLLISAPRLNSEYQMTAAATDTGGGAGGTQNPIRNKSANLYIRSIKLQVNNAQGHIDKVGAENEAVEAFITAERLFEMTRENAGSHYFKEGGFRAWRDSGMAVLLSSAQFAPGLMVSDGVAYPINVNIEMELQNRHVDVSALDFAGYRKHKILQDQIRAQPQCTAIFTKIILATTETSATTNAMNYPLDSAERILNSAGSMR